MSRLTQKGQGAPLGLFKTSTDSSLTTACGQRFDLEDGREVVLVLAGGSALDSGKLHQAPAIVSNHQNMAASTVSAGATSITVTLGATAVTANQYAGGYLVINAGTGAGQTLKIASHPAANLSTSLVVTLEDAVVTATNSASTKACLIPDLYTGVIISPTAPTNVPVGVTLYPIAAGSYGYIQTKGAVSCLADAAAPVVGSPISASVATAGAITQTPYAANVVTAAVVGRALQAGVSAEYRTVSVDL